MDTPNPDIQRREISCHLDEKSTLGYVERRELTMAERALKSAKILGIFWLCAGFAVFIPILHFVLVPALALIGLVGAISTWTVKAEILRGEFTCPSCKKVNAIDRKSESFPSTVRCNECHMTLRLKAEFSS